MPGQSGLDAATALVDTWDTQAKPFPALVFVTAYDQYAVAAFEAQALDYVLKPVQTVRLQKTVSKLQLALADKAPSAINFEATMSQLRGLMDSVAGASHAQQSVQPLTVIQASVGTSIRMVPVAEVLYFEAADKYVRVLTASHEYLIRTPLKELIPQLNPNSFWQIHRGTLVNAGTIDSVNRDESGKLSLALRGRSEKLAVSRLYAHLFKAM
jgi:DNA-binding LytR/AlgR family response regulator